MSNTKRIFNVNTLPQAFVDRFGDHASTLFLGKPAGRNIAHQFINTGQEMLEILDVGTVEEGDIVYYPDEDVYLLRKEKLAFSGASSLTEWDTDPNQ